MGLRVIRRGRIYHVVGTVAGRRIRQSCQTTDKQRAEEIAAQIEAKAWQRSVYGEQAVVTFEDTVTAYLEAGGDTRFLLPLIQHFRGRHLRSINPGDIQDAALKIYPGRAPATLNRQGIAPAQAVINFGHQRGWCAPIRVRRFKEPKTQKVAVDRVWIDAVRAECKRRRNPYLSALMLFLFQHGCRITEAIEMEPRDLNLMEATAWIPETKNGDPREVALTTEIVVELSNLPPRKGRVFGYSSRQSVYGVLKNVCKAAKIPYLGTHQPGRHSFATVLHEEHGFSAKQIADAGGWRSTRIVEDTYIHTDDVKRRAAAAMDGTELTQRRRRKSR